MTFIRKLIPVFMIINRSMLHFNRQLSPYNDGTSHLEARKTKVHGK